MSTVFLNVTNLTGKKLRIEIEPQEFVLTLKKQVQAVEGYLLEEIGIVFGGDVLENDRIISDYRLQNESSLTLVRLDRNLVNL